MYLIERPYVSLIGLDLSATEALTALKSVRVYASVQRGVRRLKNENALEVETPSGIDLSHWAHRTRRG
jgi:hypothetical protein